MNRGLIRWISTLIALALTISAFTQETYRPLTKRLIVKTNLLSLLAQRPSVSLEKIFPHNFSTEVSFVQGQFNEILLTDHYDYKGYLIRVKKHFGTMKPGDATLYWALYAGNLKRNIQSNGLSLGGGYLSSPGRNFSANSIRGGGSMGCMYIAKSRIVIDALIGLGCGRYTKIYKPDFNRNSRGYLDTQIWLSVGYCL